MSIFHYLFVITALVEPSSLDQLLGFEEFSQVKNLNREVSNGLLTNVDTFLKCSLCLKFDVN